MMPVGRLAMIIPACRLLAPPALNCTTIRAVTPPIVAEFKVRDAVPLTGMSMILRSSCVAPKSRLVKLYVVRFDVLMKVPRCPYTNRIPPFAAGM
jgi:hypothetical protein